LTVPPDVLLTKAAEAPVRPARGRGGDQVADHLQQQAVRRLRLVALLTVAAQLVLWLAVNLAQGTLAEEFASPLEWGFPAGVMVASLGIALLTRSERLLNCFVAQASTIAAGDPAAFRRPSGGTEAARGDWP
jgi:hypothetical protein